jgi:hypothetical protein
LIVLQIIGEKIIGDGRACIIMHASTRLIVFISASGLLQKALFVFNIDEEAVGEMFYRVAMPRTWDGMG